MKTPLDVAAGILIAGLVVGLFMVGREAILDNSQLWEVRAARPFGWALMVIAGLLTAGLILSRFG